MKHLITRLLLVMICACAIPTAGNAFTLTIAGNANFMDSETVQSSSFTLPGVSQSTSGNSSDFYFWATGEFKLSQADPAPTDWETFNTDKVFQITESTINWNVHDVSNLGTGCKFIHLHIGTKDTNYVEVQDKPFAGHEGVWPVPSYNHTLFVGIASSNRHQIQYKEDTNTYEEYKFYVNQEDLDNDGEFGFRFYSEPNGGIWMGNEGKPNPNGDGSDEKDLVGKVIGEDYEFGNEITTSGIKRYFLKETGAYAINVKSYEPEKDKVVFTLTKLDTDVVLRELYIGGTWNNGLVNETEKVQIPSSHGKYQPVTITVEDNCAFRFYSEKTNGNWMGPVYTNGINVDAEGTLPYTTVGNGNTFKLAEAGTYTIKVSEYLADNNKVTFTVTKEADPSFTVPTTLYLRNSRNSDDTPIAMKRQDGAGDNDRNTCKFFAEVDYNANEDFQFNFIEKNESNWPDRGIVCYPSANELSVSANTPARIDNVGTCTDNPDKAWSYNSTEGGKITVSVYFKKNGYATVEVVGNSDKNYYFIGDMNNWFSNEFDGNLGGKDNNGETIAKGINTTRWNADKDNW